MDQHDVYTVTQGLWLMRYKYMAQAGCKAV